MLYLSVYFLTHGMLKKIQQNEIIVTDCKLAEAVVNSPAGYREHQKEQGSTSRDFTVSPHPVWTLRKEPNQITREEDRWVWI